MKMQRTSAIRCLGIALAIAGVTAASFAAPFDSATVTRVENKVGVGEIVSGRASALRPAAVSETVKANHFVQTGGQSRAELQFKDTSLVRVGQNTVFSFEAKSRTLSLEKGDMLFYVAPGQGGGTIKTPAISAAITGTLCKVAPDMIAVLRGSITITVNGKKIKIPSGWAVKVVNRKARIYMFDPNEANRGKLYSMGPLPEDPALFIMLAGNQSRFPTVDGANAIDFAVVNPRSRPDPVRPQPPIVVTVQPAPPPPQTNRPTDVVVLVGPGP